MKNTKIKKSKLHGNGVFAVTRIKPHAFIGTFEGNKTNKNGMHVLFVECDDCLGNGWKYVGTGIKRSKLDCKQCLSSGQTGIDGTGTLRYLNHSSTPNAIFFGDKLFSLKNIQPNVEITFDYGFEPK